MTCNSYMNRITSLSKWAVFSLALVVAADVFAQSQPVTAKVRAVRGTAKYSSDHVWKPLKVNDSLKPGTVIKTEGESTVDLFINNSVIRVTPDTTIGLEKLLATDTGADKVTETQLYLKNGRILGNVKKLAAASTYQIKTPNGVTGVRGTDFDISFVPLPNGQFQLTVKSITGTLVSSAANNQGVIVTAVINTGEAWTPADGTIKLPPLELQRLVQEVEELRPDHKQGPPDGKGPGTVPNNPPVNEHASPVIGK